MTPQDALNRIVKLAESLISQPVQSRSIERRYGLMIKETAAAALAAAPQPDPDEVAPSDQIATNLRYARGLIRKAAANGAAFVDINVDVLAYLVESRRTLNDRLRWAEQRAAAAPQPQKDAPCVCNPAKDEYCAMHYPSAGSPADPPALEEKIKALRDELANHVSIGCLFCTITVDREGIEHHEDGCVVSRLDQILRLASACQTAPPSAWQPPTLDKLREMAGPSVDALHTIYGDSKVHIDYDEISEMLASYGQMMFQQLGSRPSPHPASEPQK